MMSPGSSVPGLDQHGRDRAAALVELGFDDDAFGGAVGIGLEVEHFGLQQDRLEQLVEVGALGRRNLDVEHFAAHRFDERPRAAAAAVRTFCGLASWLVDLVDRHDDRHAGRLGVVDRFDRLRHHAVVGRNHQDGDIGGLGAAGTHGREGGVAGRVDEGDLLAVLLDLIGADMLGDAAGFAGNDVGVADGVEQRGLAVVDVAHDGDDRRTRHQVFRVDPATLNMPSSMSDSATRLTVWPNSAAISSAVSASMTSPGFMIWPCFIKYLTTSTARSDMRCASSWMVMVSGRMTSRTIFSRGS